MSPERLSPLIAAASLAAKSTATPEQVAAFCALYAEFKAKCEAGTSSRRELFLQLKAMTDDENAGPRLGGANDKCRIMPPGGAAGRHQRKRRTAAESSR